jgi:tetratricopeptide (TPR) repeat protein
MRSARLLPKWIGPIALSLIMSGSGHSQEAQSPCAAADAFRLTGLLGDAKTRYAELVRDGDKTGCAIQGLREIFAAEQAQRDQACAAADALRGAGFLEEANDEYKKLLTGNAKPQCAVQGLLETRKAKAAKKDELCSPANALRDAGYLDEAKTTYIKLLKDDSTLDCAVQGLVSVKKNQDDSSIKRERALAAFGLHDEALKSIQKRLKEDDNAVVPDDLQYLSGGWLPGWRTFRRNLIPWTMPFLEIAAGALLLLLGLAIARNFLARLLARRTLNIGEFDSDSLEEKFKFLGKDFPPIIRSQLNRIAAAAPGGQLDLVTGPIREITAIKELAGALPATPTNLVSQLAKAIPALIDWLLPERIVTLTGKLHQPGRRGAGVSMQLVENGRIFANYTFWHHDFDDASDGSPDKLPGSLYQIAEYAAIWLVFEWPRFGWQPFELLGARDWKSYAYFRAGCFADEENRGAAAKNLYIKALQTDRKLRGARVNLARRFLREGKFDVAKDHLERAKNDYLSASYRDRRQDPTLYSVLYNLAVLEYKNKNVVSALQHTEDLTQRIEIALKKKLVLNKTNREFRHHLEIIRPAAMAMLGGLMIEQREYENGRKNIEAAADISGIYSLVHYNVACSYSLIARHEIERGNAAKHNEYLNKSYEYLVRSFYLDKKWVDYSKDDRSLECLQNELANKYKELIEEYETPPSVESKPVSEMPLAKIEIIGEEHARKLQEEGIFTKEKLLQNSLDPTARRELAKKLNVTEWLVTKWAYAMDLLRIVGLEPLQLKLLSRVGIERLSDLESSSPTVLKAMLDDVSSSIGGIEAPDVATVSVWINDARTNTRPKVVS